MGAEYVGSFGTSGTLPKFPEPKVAFLGRSNVGKSSLINLLTASKVARVSKTPGRTRALNLFSIDGKLIFGDFPGFGYAKVSKQEREEWRALVEKFLKPEYFDLAIHIVDARHPGMEIDLQLQGWLRDRSIPCLIVLNKADKLNRKERADAERKAREAFSGQPLLFASSFTKEGKQELDKTLQKLR